MPDEVVARTVRLDGRTVALFGKPYRWHATGTLSAPYRLRRLPGSAEQYPMDPHGLMIPSPCAAWNLEQQRKAAQAQGLDGSAVGMTEEEQHDPHPVRR